MNEDDELKRIENQIEKTENKVENELESENERLRKELEELKKEHAKIKKLKEESKKVEQQTIQNKEKITEVEIEVNFDSISKFSKILYNVLIEKKVLFYILLILAIIIGVVIRTASLPALGASPLFGNNYLGVGGSLTGLDPYEFYTQMNNVLSTGNVPVINHLQYLPLGRPSRSDDLLIAFFGAYQFRLLQPIFPAATPMTWFMLYPVFAALLATLLLFLIGLEIFDDYRIAALSAWIFPVFQTLLNRTTAGFSTKDAMGFLFILLTIYFLAKALKSKNTRSKIMYGFLVALSTGFTADASGFAKFLIFLVPLVYIILILFNYAKKEDLLAFLPFALFIPFMSVFINFSSESLISGSQYYPMYLCYVMVLFKVFIYDKYSKKLKIPFVNPGMSVATYALIIIVVLLGIIGKLGRVFSYLISEIQNPLGIGTASPITQTIAEYGQVNFAGRVCDASGLIGACGDPNTISINLILMMLAAIVLLYYFFKGFKHWYLPFLGALPFLILLNGGTYAPGTGATSILLLFLFASFIPLLYFVLHRKEPEVKRALSLIVFATLVSIILSVGFFLSNQTTNYYKYGLFGLAAIAILAFTFDKIGEKEGNKAVYIIAFIFMLLTILFSNIENQLLEPVGFSGIIVIPFAAVFVTAFFVRHIIKLFKRSSKSVAWTVSGIIVIIALLIIAFDLNSSLNMSYNASQQSGSGLALWGPTMQWINYNSQANSSIISWWDYGYWEEAIANRTSVADGSNAYGYQSMIAKYLFEATSPYQYATYLNYIHQPTFAVISGSEVEKFSAISTIALNYTQFTPLGESQEAYNQGTVVPGSYKYLAVFGGNSTGIAPLEANMVINGVPWNASNTLLIQVIIPFNSTNNTFTQGAPYGVVYNELTQQSSAVLPFRNECTYGVGCNVVNNSSNAIPGAVLSLNASNVVDLHIGGYKTLPGGYALAQIPLASYGNSPGVLFLPEKSLNMLFTKLYLLNETVPGFSLAFSDNLPVNSMLSIANQVLTNINVYSINYTALSKYNLLTNSCSLSESATNYCDNLSYLPAVFNQSSNLISSTPI